MKSQFGVHVEITPQGLGVFEQGLRFAEKVWHGVAPLAAVGGEDSGDFVLVDSIPALSVGEVFFWDYETRGQVTCEGKAFVQDQGHAIVAVTGRGDDFACQTKGSKEVPAISEFELDVLFRRDRKIRQIFGLVQLIHGIGKAHLAFQEDQISAQIFQFLGQARMVGMEMRDQQVFDLIG